MNTRPCIAACAFATVVIAAASPAHAHLVSTELGPFYDGAAHPVVTPADIMTIAALAILGSFSGRTPARRQFLALTTGWAAGLVAAFAFSMHVTTPPAATASLLIVLGSLGLARLRLEQRLLICIAGLVGVFHGVTNGAEAQSSDGTWLTAIGVTTGVLMLSSTMSALAIYAEQRQATIALRIAASWIVAIAVLMLGWELRMSG